MSFFFFFHTSKTHVKFPESRDDDNKCSIVEWPERKNWRSAYKNEKKMYEEARTSSQRQIVSFAIAFCYANTLLCWLRGEWVA